MGAQMPNKKVTFADIAAYTNFSKTTISRYFNDPDSLTIENQEKIKKALDDLGYHQNKLAKVLANGKSEFVGIIIPSLYMHYYAEMLNQILTTFKNYHYKFLVFVSNDKKETEKQYIEELLAYKVEGLIIMSHVLSSEELASYKIPIVGIEREDLHISSVNTDNYMGAVQATSLLIRNGCKVLLHINDVPDPNLTPAHRRIDGFSDTCREHENDIHYECVFAEFGKDYISNSKKMDELFHSIEEKYPDSKKGIFLTNDTYAKMFLNNVFRKYGKLPDCYEIVGFDNSPDSIESVIPITTIDQRIRTIAEEAMALLVEQMNELKKRKPNPLKEPVHKVVTPALLRRDTTT